MVDTSKYQEILECIISGQVPSNTIALYFKDKKFYQYYKENLVIQYMRNNNE